MNTQETINKNLRLFDPMAKRHIAGPKYSKIIAINTGNTIEHEKKKLEVAYDLLKEGRTIITEGKLLNGKRPDICTIDTIIPTAYEIMKSEKDDSIKGKKISYKGIDIVEIRLTELKEGKEIKIKDEELK
jgi:hypothetical protein